MDISTMIEQVGRSPSATARVTGLSRMTVQRVREGDTSPTLKTLRELALAAGYDIDVRLVAPSDPAASTAARVLLDPAMPTIDAQPPEVTAWVDRLKRHHLTQPDEILALAGKYSAPQHRQGARFFAPRLGFSHSRVTSVINNAGSAAGGRFALSGVAAAHYYLARADLIGPTLLWAEQADAACESLVATFREAHEYQPGGIIVASAQQSYLVDVLADEPENLTVVSPVQAAIDLHGLGYANIALNITEGW